MPKTTTKRQATRAYNKNVATPEPEPTPPSRALVGALKLTEACEYLSLSRPTLLRLVARGLLRPNRYTRHLLFSIKELDQFLESGVCE